MANVEKITRITDLKIAHKMSKPRAIHISGAPDMAIKALQQDQKGHWITEDMFDGDMAYRCSKCSGLFWLETGTPKDNEYNFCPNCGTKMESEVEDGRN